MRTTVDIPEAMLRQLKVRASLTGTSIKALLIRYIEGGLREAEADAGRRHRSALPVIIPPHGNPIRALSAEEIRRMEESEDIDRLG